jgi:hypothetical protein
VASSAVANASKNSNIELPHLRADLFKCVQRKVLIVELDESTTFSNRLMAIISAAQLSVITQRPLIINWKVPSKQVDVNFDDIFYGKTHSIFSVGNASYFDTLPLKQVGKRCTLDFQANRDQSLRFFTNSFLFERIQESCDFLLIKNGGEYYGNVLPQVNATMTGGSLSSVFTSSPLHHVMTCIFKFRSRFRRESKDVLGRLAAMGPFLSLHIESQYSSAAIIAQAFDCINSMLKQHVIKIVYISSDDVSYEHMAKKLISDASKLLVAEGQRRKSSSNDVNGAIKDVYVTSHSDYCASISLNHSSLSQVAISSGPCIFIDVLQGDRYNILFLAILL